MLQVEPMARVEDEEYLYRRIPVKTRWFWDGVVRREAFRPNERDGTGLSLERAIFCSPEEAAAYGTNPSGYYIAKIKAGDIRTLGLDVLPKPSGHPGHAELPGLNHRTGKTSQAKEWQVQLADLATREGVLGPYRAGQPKPE